MNNKQFAFIIFGIWSIIFGIWSIISWISAFFANDTQIEYVAGRFGVWMVVIGFCIGIPMFLFIIVFGILKGYEMLGE
jgi:hypothetical protein